MTNHVVPRGTIHAKVSITFVRTKVKNFVIFLMTSFPNWHSREKKVVYNCLFPLLSRKS